jgi:hypothetical protein
MSDFAATKATKARATHQCEECWRTIHPGETYHRTAGSWEGDFFTIKACGHCCAFRKHISEADDYYYECYFGGVSVWVENGYTDPTDLPGTTWEQRLGLYRMARHYRGRWRDTSGHLRPVPADPEPKAKP